MSKSYLLILFYKFFSCDFTKKKISTRFFFQHFRVLDHLISSSYVVIIVLK